MRVQPIANRICIAALVVLWSRVIVIPWATFREASSSQWAAYQIAAIKSASADESPTRRQRDGAGAGGALALLPYVEAVYCVCIGVLFTGGLAFLKIVDVWQAHVGTFLSGAFCCGCLFGVWWSIGEAIESADWGFTVRAVGFSLSALGLFLGAVGVALTFLLEKRVSSQKFDGSGATP